MIIENDKLVAMSNSELEKAIKDKGVFLHMFDGTMNEIRVKKVVGVDCFSSQIVDYTNLIFERHTIESIEIIESYNI